jgi:trehalose 6-phosphate synthase/phosphatase
VFNRSVGGVATGLSSVLESHHRYGSQAFEYAWVGWPGMTIDEEDKVPLRKIIERNFHATPVFLTAEAVENFYQGFCNKTIWPLFHYFPLNVKYEQEYWAQYQKVNQAFADEIAHTLQPNDVVWIHDYHFLLLPKLVRERMPAARIGFFLHIPFPNFEIFRLLPRTWRRELLEGLLGADLIGFHTFEYMQDFLRCVLRVLGHESNLGQIILPHRVARVGTYPMGIDFGRFQQSATSDSVRQEREKLTTSLGNVRIILSVDRLDYSKGIINRLQGLETLLESSPELRGAVVLLMVVVPSRVGVDNYDEMKKQIEEYVGKINGKFGSVSWTPIIYQYKAFDFDSLVALYGVSHVALVTPLRDGMNLIAKEYVASQADQRGVLVLSEMAGAAKELGEAIIINPNSREEVAEAIREALSMPVDEQVRRNTIMQNRLRRYDVVRWATDFVSDLTEPDELEEKLYSKRITAQVRDRITKSFAASQKRLLLLDYDGTLVEFALKPHLAIPGQELRLLLTSLGSDPASDCVLISGRRRQSLQDWFGELPIGLVAEHGAWIKERGGEWQSTLPPPNSWKPRIVQLLEMYTDRLPGALLEEKDFSVAWHYRAADPEQGAHAARELTDDLVTFTANIDVQVLQGNKIVEVRCTGMNKGMAAQHWLQHHRYDFVLAVGDDVTDEDLFAALPESAYSLRVGLTPTKARFTIQDPKEVIRLLRQFTQM